MNQPSNFASTTVLILELLSESLRSENTKPTELFMFCVDCSQSMDSKSDFHEIQVAPTFPCLREATVGDVPITDEIDEAISLDDQGTGLLTMRLSTIWSCVLKSPERGATRISNACGPSTTASANLVY